MAAPTSVEEYLARLPDDRRTTAEEIRGMIRAAAPEATETIAYNMPAYRSDGDRFLVSFAAFKEHYSLFPASDVVVEALGEELTPYLRGRGTIRFEAADALPVALITRVVRVRLAEVAARARDGAPRRPRSSPRSRARRRGGAGAQSSG